jgi:hypothetical protein
MMTRSADPSFREQAIALRQAGKSLREIKEALGPVGNDTLNAALKGVPPAESTGRPNAKDDLRERARQLRREGKSYNEIRAELGVAKSSVSLWVRDLPVPESARYVLNERRQEGLRRYHDTRAAQRSAETAAAADEIGQLTDRELLIAGAIAYWCEGSKSKPYRHCHRVIFMNSDPRLIQFFLRFLEAAGIGREDLILNLSIHESADVVAAQEFWADVTGAGPSQFRAAVLKRHNPKTVRKNVNENYHGCLRVVVRRSAGLYRQIEGWAAAAMAGE